MSQEEWDTGSKEMKKKLCKEKLIIMELFQVMTNTKKKKK